MTISTKTPTRHCLARIIVTGTLYSKTKGGPGWLPGFNTTPMPLHPSQSGGCISRNRTGSNGHSEFRSSPTVPCKHGRRWRWNRSGKHGSNRRCAMRRTAVSPAQRAEMRGDISGSDALPESERVHGKIAWQKTSGRAQMSGAAHWEIRVTR